MQKTEEFKREVWEEHEAGKSNTELGKKHGVTRDTIARWIEPYGRNKKPKVSSLCRNICRSPWAAVGTKRLLGISETARCTPTSAYFGKFRR